MAVAIRYSQNGKVFMIYFEGEGIEDSRSKCRSERMMSFDRAIF